MGGYYQNGFPSLKFTKKGADIITKANEKLVALKAKVEDRTGRINKLCKEYKIDVADFFANIDEYAGRTTASNSAMKAGDKEALKVESSLISEERGQIKSLELIARNLLADEKFSLSFEETEYLGF
jgi:hypothetical protein